MKPKYSVRDSRGSLWVACSECVRGGNGVEPDGDNLCASGFDIKKGGDMGCFSGQLLSVYTEPKPRNIKPARR